MGADINPVGFQLYEISYQVEVIKETWDLYVQIYNTKHNSEKPFDVSPILFRNIYFAFHSFIITSAIRLFDPPIKMFKKAPKDPIIGYYSLIEQLLFHSYPDGGINRLKLNCDEIKSKYRNSLFRYRNKFIGHNDLDTITGFYNKKVREIPYSVPELVDFVDSLLHITKNFEEFIINNWRPMSGCLEFNHIPQRTDYSINSADADKLMQKIIA